MPEALPRDEMEMLAAEYVLGVLDDSARAEARLLIDTNGTMRLLTEQWEDRLSGMNEAYAEVAAPDIWPALDRQLFAARRKRNRIFWLVAAALAVVAIAKLAFWARLLM